MQLKKNNKINNKEISVWEGKITWPVPKKEKQNSKTKPQKDGDILKSHRDQPERAPNGQTKPFSATKYIIMVLNFNPKSIIQIHESILI